MSYIITNYEIFFGAEKLGHMRLDCLIIQSSKVNMQHNKNLRVKQVQYQTLVKILTYLQESNKITFNKDGSIVWIFVNTRQAKKFLHESKPFKKF